jgi:serine/threonine-protein kinase
MADVRAGLEQALADRYRVERELGSGGMATVYLAQDLKHDRPVALKVLRPELAAVLGGERFLKEIQVTSHLQHPHILPLFDSGEADGLLFYVMPHVEGESLRDRLTREKQLGIEEAVRLTTQVASALDYAHRRGVLHRDIKPENILLEEGQALIADFGIALALRRAGGNRLTETGLSLGTPQYMSPEQASGDRELDARSDIYSLACVLYELLAGEPPHTGPTVQAVVAKVLTAPVTPIGELRRTVPVHVAAALDVALAKLPADRFASATQFAEALTHPGLAAALVPGRQTTGAVPSVRRSGARARRLFFLLLSLWALVATVVAVWSARRLPRPTSALTSRWVLELPAGFHLPSRVVSPPLAISANGRVIAVVAERSGTSRLFLRTLDDTEPREVPGTEGASGPFFSPDGEWVGFFSGPRLLKVALRGGTPVLVTQAAEMFLLGTWTTGDSIVFGRPGFHARVSATGGTAVRLPEDAAAPYGGKLHLLPGGNHALVDATSRGRPRVAVLTIATGGLAVLEELGEALTVAYVPTGHLVFNQGGLIRAIGFDARRRATVGAPFPVGEGALGPCGWYQAWLTVSDAGTLLRAAGSADSLEAVWVDRAGRLHGLRGEVRCVVRPRLSPDGRFLVGEVGGEDAGVWIFDLERGTGRPVARGAGADPIWSQDGRRVTYTEDPWAERTVILSAPFDGTSRAETLLTSDHIAAPHSWSPDGRWLAYYEITPEGRDIWVVPPGGRRQPYLVTPHNERSPGFSPDGRWIAYVSDESGRDEVYVRGFPEPGAPRQVSEGGGREPVWARNGRELFYRLGDRILAVPVRTGRSFEAGAPRVLFEGPFAGEQETSGSQSYDVSPDGQRFLMVRSTPPDRIVVTLNWLEELKRAEQSRGQRAGGREGS